MSTLNILIIGSSIAGPSTAYFLSRAGFCVTLIERFPSLRTGGHAIDIRTFGVSVMRKIPGMQDAVRGASTQEDGIALVDNEGRAYGVIRATGNAEQQGIVSEFEVGRGDLSKILYDLTKDDKRVKYIFNETIASISALGSVGKVEVTFTNGTPTQDFDLIVACDGATSRTRGMAFGGGARDYVHPTGSWAAYFSIAPDLLDGSKIGHGHSAPGGRFMSIGHDGGGRGNKVMFMCVNQTPSSMDGFRTASRRGGERSLKEFVAKRFGDVGWLTGRVLQEMETSQDFYASEITQVKLPTLSQNRIVFVGDAGYAAGPTGGGTSLALAGAYHLAGELLAQPNDIDAGLRGYERRMRPLIKEMQKIPPFVGTIMAPQTRWGIAVRNWIFGFVAWSGLAEWAQTYLGAAFADSGEFPLPEYEWVT